MTSWALVNGQPCASVSVYDRGLLYGDGLFETIAVNRSQCQHWSRHMQRLQQGCEQLGFPPPDKQQLAVEVQQLFHLHALADKAVLKIILTRGVGGRGYSCPPDVSPTRLLQCHPWPAEESLELDIVWCRTRWSRQRQLAGVKHLNRLEQVLARQELQQADEGLMCDEHDQVISATQANVFLVSQGTLITPKLDHSGVAGIMRSIVIDLAQFLGIQCVERRVTLADVYAADQCFLTNSLRGIVSVRTLGHHSYRVISPIMQQLRNAYENGAVSLA